jgi:3-oxoacyl-[acyl-carrier protein] reductase
MDIKQIIKKIILNLRRPVKVTANISYLNPNGRLNGKRIIVTGGSRGIGKAIAKRLIDEGAKVIITGRNEESLKRCGEELGCKYLILDMLDISSFDCFIENADSELGGLDCLVNNAGVSLHEKSFFDVTEETFDVQVSTNFKGPLFLTQAFLKKLRSNNSPGNVLFISSETGITMDIRPYGYTKAAINSMVQGLAYVLAKDNIRVNAIAPGITATEMTGYSAEENLYCQSNMTDRVYMPEEVAETACFLLSDISGCISGQIIVCNNGRSINSRLKKK